MRSDSDAQASADSDETDPFRLSAAHHHLIRCGTFNSKFLHAHILLNSAQFAPASINYFKQTFPSHNRGSGVEFKVGNLGRYQEIVELAKRSGGVDSLIKQIKRRAVSKAAPRLVGTGRGIGTLFGLVASAAVNRVLCSLKDHCASIIKFQAPEDTSEKIIQNMPGHPVTTDQGLVRNAENVDAKLEVSRISDSAEGDSDANRS